MVMVQAQAGRRQEQSGGTGLISACELLRRELLQIIKYQMQATK